MVNKILETSVWILIVFNTEISIYNVSSVLISCLTELCNLKITLLARFILVENLISSEMSTLSNLKTLHTVRWDDLTF